MEGNPDSLGAADLRLLRREGVNRLSIGMQSANNDILKMIGRRHNYKQVELAVKAARDAGFDNISLDLIYGLPSQSKADWADTLAKAMALEVRGKYEIQMDKLQLQNGIDLVMKLLSRANKYIDETAPWVLARDEAKKARLATVM